jgi:hypothetical protein
MGQSPFSLILAKTSLEKRVQNNKKKNTSIFLFIHILHNSGL